MHGRAGFWTQEILAVDSVLVTHADYLFKPTSSLQTLGLLLSNPGSILTSSRGFSWALRFLDRNSNLVHHCLLSTLHLIDAQNSYWINITSHWALAQGTSSPKDYCIPLPLYIVITCNVLPTVLTSEYLASWDGWQDPLSFLYRKLSPKVVPTQHYYLAFVHFPSF